MIPMNLIIFIIIFKNNGISFSKLHSLVAGEDVEVLARYFAVGNGGVGGRRESGRSVQSIAIWILLALNDDNAEIKDQ